jgi:hypothetical protein
LPKGVKSLVQRMPSVRLKHPSNGSGAFRLPSPYSLILDALKLILARREVRRIAADLRNQGNEVTTDAENLRSLGDPITDEVS